MPREIAMYAHFYQLSENPFNLTPDPKFHYVNTSTREAMASILHGIKSRKGFITLIAEAGTGKTTLLKRIVDEIEGETQVVFVFNPGVSFDELLEFICSELGIETHGCKRLHLLDRLNSHLLEQLTRGRNVVVMIDEAQTLEDSVLEELRLLSNLETAKEKILQILLSGQPELEEKLRKPSLRQLRQRIGVRATLKPVRLDEMQAYVETRLRSAGAERNDLFTSAALKRIWQASQGIPRVINVICDNAMMLAFADGRKRITPKLLREAVRDLEGEVPPGAFGSGAPEWLSSRGTGYALAAAAVLAAAIPLASMLQHSFDPANGVVAEQTAVQLDAVESSTVVDAGTDGQEAVVDATSGSASAVAGDTKAAADSLDVADMAPAPGVREDAESESLAALESDARGRPAIVDSMRRAEILARSTAARLYGTDRDGEGALERRDITDAARDEVSRNGGLKEPEVAVHRLAAASDSVAKAGAIEKEVAAAPELNPQPGAVSPTPAESAMLDKPTAASTAPEQVQADAKAAEKAAEQEAAKRETAKREAAKQEAAKQEIAKREAAKREAAKQEAVKQEAAKQEAAKQEAATKEVKAAEVAAASAPAPAPRGPFTLGRAVRVKDGDTVWDIALEHYGSAGSAVLKRILINNPGVRDPLKLEVGSTVFLPYSRPEQMVRKESAGYRVVLVSGTSRERLEEVSSWASAAGGEVRMTSSTSGVGPVLYEVSIVGLPSESVALSVATNLFESSATGVLERTAMR
jgi:general secretion pathway protein A